MCDFFPPIYLNIYPYYKNHPVIPPSHPGVTREILLYEGRNLKNNKRQEQKSDITEDFTSHHGWIFIFFLLNNK